MASRWPPNRSGSRAKAWNCSSREKRRCRSSAGPRATTPTWRRRRNSKNDSSGRRSSGSTRWKPVPRYASIPPSSSRIPTGSAMEPPSSARSAHRASPRAAHPHRRGGERSDEEEAHPPLPPFPRSSAETALEEREGGAGVGARVLAKVREEGGGVRSSGIAERHRTPEDAVDDHVALSPGIDVELCPADLCDGEVLAEGVEAPVRAVSNGVSENRHEHGDARCPAAREEERTTATFGRARCVAQERGGERRADDGERHEQLWPSEGCEAQRDRRGERERGERSGARRGSDRDEDDQDREQRRPRHDCGAIDPANSSASATDTMGEPPTLRPAT